MASSRPRWLWLYGIAAVAIGAIALIAVSNLSGRAQHALEFVVVVMMVCLVEAWLRHNTPALLREKPPHTLLAPYEWVVSASRTDETHATIPRAGVAGGTSRSEGYGKLEEIRPGRF